MPYIDKKKRELIDSDLGDLGLIAAKDAGPGELAYSLWYDLGSYINLRKRAGHKINYAELSSIIGVLESVKNEFIRKHVNPYEDKKIEENGDCPLL